MGKRWHPDLNWGMEALQASALPLGYATFGFDVGIMLDASDCVKPKLVMMMRMCH